MIVYRFEKDGIGPYANPWGAGTLSKRKENTKSEVYFTRIFKELVVQRVEEHKYREFTKDLRVADYVFGCPSKKALRGYFGTSFKYLFKKGFRIKRYNVPDEEVVHMGIEVMFPAKYHKFQRPRVIKKKLIEMRGYL